METMDADLLPGHAQVMERNKGSRYKCLGHKDHSSPQQCFTAHRITTLQPHSLAAHPVRHMVMDTRTPQVYVISNDSVRSGGIAMYGLTVWICMPVRELRAGRGTHKQAGGKSVEGWSQ